MRKELTNGPPEAGFHTISRREILAGAAVTALAVATPTVLAAPRAKIARALPVTMPVRRYMAAAAALTDGRILITGGYDRPWTENSVPTALNSALIVDPTSGRWFAAASLLVPRARHAAVALPDGRIAVIGGVGTNPTASVEIYDPWTNTWTAGAPLAQPRYDHTAVSNGSSVYVLGGSSQSMIPGVELLRLEGADELSPGF